jgi:CheY-like chemotaxis protein
MATRRSSSLIDGTAAVCSADVFGLPVRVPAGYARVPRDVHDALVFTVREQVELVMGMLAVTAAASGEAVEEYQPPPSRDWASRLRGTRVLVVDDDPTQAALLSRRLTKTGFDGTQIEHVPSGLDAIAAADAGLFELAFVDWRMPGLDGLETTRRLRRAAPGLLIVGHTSECTRESRAAFIAAGADDCIAKPVTQLLMHAIVWRWLTGDHGR